VIKHIIVAIDGPVAAGKTTVGRDVAKRIGANFLDSGKLYRVAALASMNSDKSLDDLLGSISVNLKGQRIFLDGKNVSKQINTPEVGEKASVLSKQPRLRDWVNQRIRSIAMDESIVIAGRDIGTVVLPSSHVKIFLTADQQTRAHRRFLDLRGNTSESDVLKAIEKRDERDSKRDIAPLKPADDSVTIDSTSLSKKQVVKEIVTLSRTYLNSIVLSRWWRFSYFVAGTISKWFFGYRYFGKGHIPANGPVIVIANHTSIFDVFFIGLALPRMGRYIAKEELFSIPVISACVRGYNAIPVRREGVGKKMVMAVRKALSEDGLLTIFPEGTRSKTGNLSGRYHNGTFKFAHATGAVVIPAGITGAFKILPTGRKWPHMGKVTVNVGEPIEWDRSIKHPDNAFFDSVTEKAMTKISKLAGQNSESE
jgi:CMP/dCMP kinase